jgi:hypothetical protein
MDQKNKIIEKKFDAIKTMREIRDKISLEIMDMTYEQERAYLDKLLAKGETIKKK